MLYKGEDGSTLSLLGVLLVIVSALSYAIYIVAANRPLLREIATLKLTFYVLVFGFSLFLVRVDFGANLHVVDTWYLWGNLLALAVFPTAISFLCTTQAIQYRFYPDSYFRGFGAFDSGIFRGDGFRGAFNRKSGVRDHDDRFCRDHYRCGK